MKTTLILLTRNEINGLKSLAAKIPFETVDEFFAVDFASKDGTVAYLKKLHIPVVHQKKPGRSEAFRIGAKRAKGDILVFFSPDGNENPADIAPLITAIKHGSDLAIASRFLPGSRNEEDDQLYKWRKWANQAFTILANICFGGTLTDAINGYRAIRKNAFMDLQLDAEGFAIEYQMSMRALKRNYRIQEIPTIEGNRIGGASGSVAIPTGLAFLYYVGREIIS